MDEPKVSVIVPVYNTERFLKNCLKSISDQSYKNLEIIIVNDGSTDKSNEIILEFMQKEKRALYVRQKNQGVSVARNTGIYKATGDYIFFCDSDDYIPQNAITTLIQAALKDNADVVVGNYFKKNRLGEKLVKVVPFNTAIQFIESLIGGVNHACLWNKLYRKSCVSEFTFDKKISIREDMLFNVQVLLRKPKVSFTSEAVYVYVQRKGSLVNDINEEKMTNSNLVTCVLEETLRGKVSDLAIKKMLALDAYGNITCLAGKMTKEDYESNLNRFKKINGSIKKRIIVSIFFNRFFDLSWGYRFSKILKEAILKY